MNIKTQKTKNFLFLIILLSSLFLFSLSETRAAQPLNEKEIERILNQIIQKIQLIQEKIEAIKKELIVLRLKKEIKAESYFVVNINNNNVLLEKEVEKTYPIASITKLMTAVITLENVDLEQKITLTEEMLEPLGESPALFTGLEITAENLLKAALIQSSNDAALSLTYFLNKDDFLDLMNKKAKEIEMTKTNFVDPHGLNPSNTSTASDIVKLLSYIYKKHPKIFSITKDNSFWLKDKKGKSVKFKNVNIFYQLPEFIGGKTGYTLEAKQTFAGLFSLNGNTFAIVILSSSDRQNDVLKILDWLKGLELKGLEKEY